MTVLFRRHDAQIGKVGQHFVVALVEELCGVLDRLWNSEQLLVFQMVILQQSCNVIASHAIWQWIEKRLDAWEAGRHRMLVEETLLMCVQYLTAARIEV